MKPSARARKWMADLLRRPAPSIGTILRREGRPVKRYLQGTTPALDHFFGNPGTIGMQIVSGMRMLGERNDARAFERRGSKVRLVLVEERRIRDGERRRPIDLDPAPKPGARHYDDVVLRVSGNLHPDLRPPLPPPTVNGVPIEPWSKAPRRKNKPGAGGVRARRAIERNDELLRLQLLADRLVRLAAKLA